ncbi:MAG: hypothetical protein M0Z94_00135 [Dehalococcoidales bacterium]|nr:hypothetical protein [Dehalococcoidales bacterium]
MIKVMIMGADGYTLNRLEPLLQQGGCTMASVADEQAAVEVADCWHPDIVVLRSLRWEDGATRIPARRH